MKVLISFIFTSLIMLTACGLLGSDDEPGIPGTIVFSADDEAGTPQIYTMNADGSGVRQLTRFPVEGGGTQPAWSPDGERIVFANFTGATTLGPYLWVMDADGSNMRPLKRRQSESIEALVGSAPVWSPDGKEIAFQVCTNCELGGNDYEISVVEVAGVDYDPDQVQAVTDHPASDTHPTWSPDGSRIAFVSNRDYVNADTLRFRKDLYVINVDGSGLKRLTNSGNTDIPSWQPKGHFIAYAWQHEDSDIFLYDLNSESTRKLTDLKYVGRPMWSEDGLHLLIPGTTNNDTFVFQYMDTAGEVLKEIPIKTNDISGLDWYLPKEN